LLAAISVVRYERDHRNVPGNLNALVPRYLPAVPIDETVAGNKPMLLAATDDGFIIYCRGFDGDDDGGRAVEQLPSRANDQNIEDGDWVLWPPPLQ
jgi:hypothetical protein